MNLADAVHIALRYNRNIKSAYINRVVQEFNLKVAEDEFIPNLDLSASAKHSVSASDSDFSSRSETTSDNYSASLTLSESIPTGGRFSFSWAKDMSESETDDSPKTEAFGDSWTASFSQPLLRGGGWDVNMASLRNARLNEQQNILSLKSTLSSTVTSVITAFRSYLQTKRQVEISRSSLERSKKQLEINKILVEAGRMARMELVQTEADIANKEFSYEQALNSLENARLNLVKVLDVNKDFRFEAVDEGEPDALHPDVDICLKIAYSQRPDYIQALIGLEQAETSVMQAENNRLWDLNFDSSYSKSISDQDSSESESEQWSVGLSLNVPLYGDLSRKQQYLGSKASLRQNRLNFMELVDNIENEVRDAVREVETRWTQVRLARLARTLSEQKLEVEREKLRLGRTTNFQIVSFENDLVSAQNSELDALISYRNALTNLDNVLGTTLDTWNIEFNDRRETEEDVLNPLPLESADGRPEDG